MAAGMSVSRPVCIYVSLYLCLYVSMLPRYLITSFVYNETSSQQVDKRIQEDNLQHLALFSEYGRVALGGGGTESGR